jgi:alkaline phosphatase D
LRVCKFFGEVNIDRKTRAMMVDLKNINFATVFSKTLPAKPECDRD